MNVLAPFCGVLLLVAAPATAAENPYQLIDKQIVVEDFAQCVLAQAPERSRQLLATQVNSVEEEKLARALMTGLPNCTKGRPVLTMKTGEARGALAEAVLKSDRDLASHLANLEAVPAPRPTETDGRKFVSAYGRCLAMASPANARTLIATEHGSSAEKTAMLGFDAALKDCMPIGFSYQINVGDVRNHVATALYDRAIALTGGGDPNA